MSYVLAGVAVVILVGIGVALLRASAKKHGGSRRASADETYGAGLPGSETAILAEDDSPLGDTSEHAGRQRDGRTESGQDGDPSGRGDDRADDPHVAPPVVGGEGEGRRRI